MKRRLQIIISASAASVLAFSALAQDAPTLRTDGVKYARDTMSPARRATRLSEAVYRPYQVEPYFTTNLTTEPDHTALKVRDHNDSTLTPLDQGTSQADVDTTAQIRKAIIAGKNMSVNARNVKIITLDGRVTLRGPAETEEERRLIGQIADRIARAENVDNQLEFKLTTSSNK